MNDICQVILSETHKEELETFYKFQLDEEASYLAAFTARDSNDRTAYIDKYSKFLTDPSINMKTIRVGGEIVGSIAKFEMEGNAEITYWIDKKFWGRGIASEALKEFLLIEKARPIKGRAAFDNLASRRVLEKNGFAKIGVDRGFANARQAEIEEVIYLKEK